MITDSKALPKVRSVGSRPAENQIADVISMLLPAGRLTEQDLPDTGDDSGAGQCDDMAPKTGAGRRLQKVDVRRRPGPVLHRRENERQRGGADAGADSDQDDGEPEAPGGRMSQRRGDRAARRVAFGCRS